MMDKLKPAQKNILKSLLENPYRLSTTSVAHKSNVSWNTADKYLRDFQRRQWVGHATKGQKGKKDLWFPLL